MAEIDDIIATVEGLPVAQDGSLTLAAADFAGIDVVGAFFTSVIGAQSYTLADASRTSGSGTITVRGTAEVLGYAGVAAAVTFATTTGQDGAGPAPPNGVGVTVSVTGTLVSGTPTPLPIVSWIDIVDVSVSATVAEPYNAVSYRFAASIVLSGETAGSIPITISRRDGGPWTFQAADAAGHPVTPGQLVALLGGQALEQFLPSELVRIFENLAISSLSITFDATAETVTEIGVGLMVTNGWTLTSGLVLDPNLHIALTLRNPTDDATRDATAVVTGTVEIDGTKVPVFVQADVSAGGTSSWLVGLDPATSGVTLPSLSGLFTLAGGSGFTKSLPGALANLPCIQIDPLLIGFTLSPQSLRSVRFRATTTSTWSIIDGFLTVKQLAFDLTLAGLDGNAKSVGGSLTAVFGFTDEAGLYFVCQKDPATATWAFSGGLPPGMKLNLTDLAAKLLSRFVKIPAAAPALVLDTAALTVVPGKSMTFTARSNTPWPLLDKLVFNSFTLTFSYTSGAATPFTGVLTTAMMVAGVPLKIYAGLDRSGAWSFKGTTGHGAQIEVGDLITDLADKFGVTAIPSDALAGLTISDIDVAFSSGTTAGSPTDFHFRCDGTFHIAGVELDITVAIHLASASSGYTGQFTGTLAIRKEDATTEKLDVTFARGKLTADWTSGSGHGLSLTDLASCFGFGDLPPIPAAIDLTLKTMTFVYDVPSAALSIAARTASGYTAVFVTANVPGGGTAHRRFAFAVDLPLNVRLADLPVVGDLLPDAGQYGIPEFGCWIVSGDLAGTGTASDAAVLNALIPTGYPRLPQAPLAGGVLLFGKLLLGSDTMPLELALSGASSVSAALLAPVAGAATSSAPVDGAAAAASGSIVCSGTSPDGTVWYDLHKKYGPVSLEKVWIRYERSTDKEGGILHVLMSAGLGVGGLSISVLGLGVGSPLVTFRPEFSIDGLAVSYDNGPVELSGALVGSTDPVVNFYGELILGVEQLQIVALGGYTEVEGQPSFFLYAVLDYPIGGPAFFFVTGLAAGLGFNRRLVVPPVGRVATFPLVQWAQGAGSPPPMDATAIGDTVRTVIGELSASGVVAPSVGDYWLAVGVHFTSFQLVDSFALLTVGFGSRFEIALLGVSTVQLPPAPSPPVARAELELKAAFVPAEGLLSVSGRLTPQSFVLSRDCHLTGGFALAMWFSGEHQGEFVLTLGGYGPRFHPPFHYPVVPRLDVNWQVTPQLALKGDLYFALTSSAVMTGGGWSAVWQSGGIRAWWQVQADFLLVFEPFHYYLSAGIHLGASFTVKLLFTSFTASIHAGVALEIWGPEFAGRATVDLSIISFTISFGGGVPDSRTTISWGKFLEKLMPQSPAPQVARYGPLSRGRDALQMMVAAGGGLPGTADETTEDKAPGIVQIVVQGGLLKRLSDTDGELNWVVNGEQLRLVTQSAVPTKDWTFSHNMQLASGVPEPNTDFGVGPVGVGSGDLTSTHVIEIATKESSLFQASPVLGNVPTGLWQTRRFDGKGVPVGLDPLNSTTVDGVYVGFAITPYSAVRSRTLPIRVEDLDYTVVAPSQTFAWTDSAGPAADPFDEQTVWGTIGAAGPTAVRTQLVAAIAAQGYQVPHEDQIDVTELLTQAAYDLLARPVLRLLGEQR
ncbi:DUF6603 domain-containing protein [Streptomyces sp. NPDC021749]|uniref:DUF6603 domain-containing protein n=1 Tax=Streptomyces sp. NPDC021749 TaxID=3154905 RepID=UPI00340B575F